MANGTANQFLGQALAQTSFVCFRPSLSPRQICLSLGLATVLLLTLIPGSACGQRGRLPQLAYYNNFGDFFQGDYKSAVRRFERESKSAYQRGSTRFLDSICYWTMMAECHYHVGNYAAAIELYERSLDLYVQYSNLGWQQRLRPPQPMSELTNAVQRAQITWFRSQRRFRIARLPDEMMMLFGQLDAARVFEEGGAYNPAEFRSVDVTEIMRCAALALHRRKTIKGPTCKYDPFTTRLVNGLSGKGSNDGSLVGAYNGVLLGIAEASTENWSRAAALLKNSLQFNGGFDHPLTPIALLEMARIGVATGKDDAAEKLCLEASYSAAIFEQYDMIEESLSLATMLHLKRNRTPYPPLVNAIAWAAPVKARLLQGSMMVRLAECHAEAGDAASAAAVLKESGRVITSRNSLGGAVVGSRSRYVSAVTRLLAGDTVGGENDLAAALEGFRNGSLGLYQMSLADSLTVSGAVTDRQADLLYTAVLRDPNANDWLLDPFESLASLVAPKAESLSRWFEIVVARKDYSRALEIAELLRRARFYSQLPVGGRLLSFRWMLHGPQLALAPEALQQRTEFLNHHPQYLQLARNLQQVNQDVRSLPISPEPQSEDWKKQERLLKAMADLSALQAGYLSAVALRREPAELAFPPQYSIKKFGKLIQPGQQALVTVETAGGYHLFLVTHEGIRYLNRLRTRDVLRLVGGLIKTLNLTDPAIKAEDLTDEKWLAAALKLKQALLAGMADDELQEVKDLVIVPDGLLWYVPFELFPIGEADPDGPDGDTPRLGDLIPLRYSPTLFLAFGAQRPQPTQNTISQRNVLVSGRMQMRGDADWVQEEIKSLTQQNPDVEPVESFRAPANLFASTVDQWLVWSDLRSGRDGPMALVPLPVGKVSGNQTLAEQTIASWMKLPVNSPRSVLLPGFESDAGAGLRAKSGGVDLFLTTCTLLASGADQILISRWNTGGETELKLAKDYYHRKKTVRPAEALRESRLAIRDHTLDPERQPRLKLKSGDPPIKATHPAYWASSIVVEIPRIQVPVPAAPAAADPAMVPGVEPAIGDGAMPDGAPEPPVGSADGMSDQPGAVDLDLDLDTAEMQDEDPAKSSADESVK